MAKATAKSTRKKAPAKAAETDTNKETPAVAKKAKSAAPGKTRMAGFIILDRGKPLALNTGEDKPKGGVLERGERATMFTRMQGAQGAINRTVKSGAGDKRSIKADNCQIVRLDHLPTD